MWIVTELESNLFKISFSNIFHELVNDKNLILDFISIKEADLIPRLHDSEENSTSSSLPISRMFRGCNGFPITDMNCCSPGRTCNVGEGDCDFDSDCHYGLKCGTDNCFYDFPTSQGYNWEIMADCCYGNFPIQTYKQEVTS